MNNYGIPDIAYIGMIIPLAGMGIGALSVWTEHQRKQKALDVLKAYAEAGQEPPPSVLESIAKVTNVSRRSPAVVNDPREGWRRFAFFGIMGIGFGLAAAWFSKGGSAGWPITLGHHLVCHDRPVGLVIGDSSDGAAPKWGVRAMRPCSPLQPGDPPPPSASWSIATSSRSGPSCAGWATIMLTPTTWPRRPL